MTENLVRLFSFPYMHKYIKKVMSQHTKIYNAVYKIQRVRRNPGFP